MATRATVEAVDLPFQEAIDFFAQKANVTTHAWTDVWQEAHARAFMVASAASEALVEDFRQAIHKAIADGTTLAEFRKDFDRIVEKRGWTGWTGEGTEAGRAWRTRVIYETNLTSAFSAGRYAQMTDPDVLAVYPIWMYRHSGNPHPRLQHKAWDGLCLLATDPAWSVMWPPNGFGCGCTVEPISWKGLARQGKTALDPSPPLDAKPHTLASGKTVWKIDGIDPGFAYNSGEAWQGKIQTPIETKMRASSWYVTPPPAPAPPPIPDPVRPSPLAARVTDHELTVAQAGWAKGLSEPEKTAIAAYKGDWAKLVNAALRRAKGAVPAVHATAVADLDAAIARSRVPRPLTVFRGIKDSRWLHAARVGDVVHEAGYTSTSIRRRAAKDFRGDALLVIDVPEGYPAAYIHHLRPTTKAQFELLIGRGARFEVVEIGDRTWRLKLLP